MIRASRVISFLVISSFVLVSCTVIENGEKFTTPDIDLPTKTMAISSPSPTPTREIEVSHKQGWISFLYDNEGSPDAYLMSPDFDEITPMGLSSLDPRNMALSPDGRHLAFGGSGFTYDLFVADVGCLKLSEKCISSVQRLTDGKVTISGDLAWSPDGKFIAFGSFQGKQKTPKLVSLK